MQLTFDTDPRGASLTDEDAASIMALLIVRHPGALNHLMATVATLDQFATGDSITHRVGDVSVTRTGELARGADDAFVPPAEAAFTAPLGDTNADAAAAPDGSTATATLAAAAAPPPAPPPPGSSDLDSDGLPWDARIHGEGKNKTNDGKWRKRRNLKPDVEAAVKAELRAALAAAPAPLAGAAAVETSPPAAVPTATQADPTPPAAAPVAAAPPPPPPPANPVPAAAPAPSAPATAAAPVAPVETAAPHSGPALFAQTMRKVTEAQTAGRITPELVTAACQAVGLAGVRDLLTRTDLIPAFEETFNSMCTPAAA